MQKCRLSFKSFQSIYIKNSVQQICRALTLWKVAVQGPFCNNFPNHCKKFTVLSSPHVHKKSREQFEWSRKKGEMVLEFHRRKDLLLLLFFLQNTQFPGVELKITLHLSTARPSAPQAPQQERNMRGPVPKINA